jgi:hypothetical protein
MSASVLQESQGWSDVEVPESCIQCVCYGVFDTALGNTIHSVSPSSVRLSALLELRSPQDFCFPDGAHDSSQDFVCATLPRKRSPGDPSEKVYFAFSCYHRQRDAECSRGAAQRSILVVTSAPIFCALKSIAVQIVFPFFDRVPLLAVDAHRYLADSLFASLSETFRTVTARSTISPVPGKLLLTSRVFAVPRVSSDNKGTVMPNGDAGLSQQRVLKLDLFVALDSNNSPLRVEGSASQPIDTADAPPAVPAVYEVEYSIPLHLALPEASFAQQLAFGASLKTLLNWFGQNISIIHWAMLTRVPVMFIGASASDVGDAVRACVHLLAPLEVDVRRFAPYATLEQIDQFISNVSASIFIAIGATNAFVVHREVSGIVRCDTRNGKVTYSSLSSMPKPHRKAFDDLLVAARDPVFKECYFRARMAKFNVKLLQEYAQRRGVYYSALCSVTNAIDVPMDKAAHEESLARLDTSDEFVVLGEDSPPRDPPTAEKLLEGTARPHDEADLGAAAAREDQEDAAEALDPREVEFLQKLTDVLRMYEGHSQKNAKILRECDVWYKSMFRYLQRIVQLSDDPQKSLYSELKAFSIASETHPDESLLFCSSDTVAACVEQQQVDRVNRLRIVTDYKERVYYMLDGLCKGNASALLRKENRYFSDFFNFPECREYNMPNQVLLHQTACTMVLYMGRFKSTTSGSLYVSKNFMCFEAGALALRKRHHIFPFDVVKNVLRDTSSVFGVFAIKLMLEVPNLSDDRDESGGAAMSTIMITLSNISDPNGLFEILHTLFEKQQRTRRLMSGIPPRHAIKSRRILDLPCPVVIPAGFYSNPDCVFVDECWENQRNYPIVGWSSKLLLSDPPSFSDFSGVRAIDMGPTADAPAGFAWLGEWIPACLLIDDITSDRLMVQQSEGSDTPWAQAAADLGVSSVGLVGVRKQDLGYIYNTSWTGVNTFRSRSWLGCTLRRRLWVRKRRLIARELPAAEPSNGHNPAENDASTDDEDVIDADSGANGICSTVVEENNDS